MDLLLLGGTRFLGRHAAAEALARGHRVTLFHRGVTGRGTFPEAEHVFGDRDGGLGALAGRRWDAVIDCCGYVPRIVGASARALAGAVGHYAFVSSVSAYASPIAEGADETAATLALEDPASEDVGRYYGALKAACERSVGEVFGDAALVVRPGLIVGPQDPTDRFPYWVRRMARGGDVLVPAAPGRRSQVVDARDLAAWLVTCAERRTAGTFNAVGPEQPLALAEAFERLRAAVGPDARLVPVDEAFLLERGITPWMELPLWVPAEDAALETVSGARAHALGLRCRPLEETARDTLAWDLARPDTAREGSPSLRPEREAELLAAWAARKA